MARLMESRQLESLRERCMEWEDDGYRVSRKRSLCSERELLSSVFISSCTFTSSLRRLLGEVEGGREREREGGREGEGEGGREGGREGEKGRNKVGREEGRKGWRGGGRERERGDM